MLHFLELSLEHHYQQWRSSHAPPQSGTQSVYQRQPGHNTRYGVCFSVVCNTLVRPFQPLHLRQKTKPCGFVSSRSVTVSDYARPAVMCRLTQWQVWSSLCSPPPSLPCSLPNLTALRGFILFAASYVCCMSYLPEGHSASKLNVIN